MSWSNRRILDGYCGGRMTGGGFGGCTVNLVKTADAKLLPGRMRSDIKRRLASSLMCTSVQPPMAQPPASSAVGFSLRQWDLPAPDERAIQIARVKPLITRWVENA